MNTPVLLCYNLKGERAKAVQMLALGLSIRVRPVDPQEYSQRLRSLLGLEAPSGTLFAGGGFEEEMLVMANFPSALINRFLNSFRQEGIPSIRLKALLTKTNSQWNSVELHAQLLQESAALAQSRANAQAKKAAEAK